MIEVGLTDARVAFSTRQGGVSEGPYSSLNLGILTNDDPGSVRKNRELMCEWLGLDPADVVMGRQVHGVEIEEWAGPAATGRDAFGTPGGELSEVDGHATTVAGLGLLVLVADCLPVALAGSGRAAMLHCGWRGLAGGILERGVASFEQPPEAAVGPGIGPCCYEVGKDVLDAFAGIARAAAGRMLDLRAVADARLRSAGVTRIEHVDLCTSCRPDLFFSHRRDRGVTGRQCGIVELTG